MKRRGCVSGPAPVSQGGPSFPPVASGTGLPAAAAPLHLAPAPHKGGCVPVLVFPLPVCRREATRSWPCFSLRWQQGLEVSRQGPGGPELHWWGCPMKGPWMLAQLLLSIGSWAGPAGHGAVGFAVAGGQASDSPEASGDSRRRGGDGGGDHARTRRDQQGMSWGVVVKEPVSVVGGRGWLWAPLLWPEAPGWRSPLPSVLGGCVLVTGYGEGQRVVGQSSQGAGWGWGALPIRAGPFPCELQRSPSCPSASKALVALCAGERSGDDSLPEEGPGGWLAHPAPSAPHPVGAAPAIGHWVPEAGACCG